MLYAVAMGEDTNISHALLPGWPDTLHALRFR